MGWQLFAIVAVTVVFLLLLYWLTLSSLQLLWQLPPTSCGVVAVVTAYATLFTLLVFTLLAVIALLLVSWEASRTPKAHGCYPPA